MEPISKTPRYRGRGCNPRGRSRSPVLAILLAFACGLGAVPAVGEDGTGPVVRIRAPINQPLGPTLRATAEADIPSETYSVIVQPALSIGGREVARLPEIRIDGVSAEPVAIVTAVSADVRTAVRREAARTHHHRAVLTWDVVADRTDAVQQSTRFRNEAPVSLASPTHPRGETRVDLRGVFVAGQQAHGTILVPAPTSWGRTSTDGALFGTFIAPIAPGCDADVLVQPVVVAARRLTPGVLTSPRASGVRPSMNPMIHPGLTRGWAVATVGARVVAAGFTRTQHHRYAGVRFVADLALTCPPNASRHRTFTAAVTRLVGHLGARVRLVDPRSAPWPDIPQPTRTPSSA
jgi:hypothetical protein